MCVTCRSTVCTKAPATTSATIVLVMATATRGCFLAGRALLRRPVPCASPLRARILPNIGVRNFTETRVLQDSHGRLSSLAAPEVLPDTISHSTDSTVASALLQEPTHVNALLASTHHILESIHAAGLPWWATIFCATFLLRTAITTPVAIYQQRALGRMMALTPVLHGWLETLKTSVGIDHRLKGRDYSTYNTEIQNAVGLSRPRTQLQNWFSRT